MKVSYAWLNKYIDKNILSPEEAARLLTFHAFEVESVIKSSDDAFLEIAVLPNRAHDCLSHEGVAKEIALHSDCGFIGEKPRPYKIGETASLKIEVEDSACRRYLGKRVENIEVRSSPAWLVKALESIGQKSINNVVDATNYVMFALGQPLHAFDAITDTIIIRKSYAGEKMVTLDDKEIVLDPESLVIRDKENPLAMAGIKGGKKAEVTQNTKNLILESANFDPAVIRKTSRRFGLRTESSIRFENEISPEMASRGMEILTGLIVEIAGTSETRVGEVVDVYPRKPNQYKIGVTVDEVSRSLGLSLTEKDIGDCFNKLNFPYRKVNVIENVLNLAPKLIGVPYRYGSSITFDAPRSFDCSGLVAYIYRESGVNLPRMAIDQYFFTERVTSDLLQPGDLIFSRGQSEDGVRYKSIEFLPDSSCDIGISHVGLYLGDQNVVHATGVNEKRCVILEKLSDSGNFKNVVGYGRVVSKGKEHLVVSMPYERLDLWPRKGAAFSSGTVADLVEEIGRILGLEKINAVEPVKSDVMTKLNQVYSHMERVRDMLTLSGYSEIYGYTFSRVGELCLENPINKERSYLRFNLSSFMEKQLAFNKTNADLLGLDEIRLFEIGNVFDEKGESIHLVIGSTAKEDLIKLTDYGGKNIYEGRANILEFDFGKRVESLADYAADNFLVSRTIKRLNYSPFSVYPFIVRDIAVFVSKDIGEKEVSDIIASRSGPLLKLIRLFDVFKKGTKISYAFRLVFQSNERTLKNEEVADIMQNINNSLSDKGWQIR